MPLWETPDAIAVFDRARGAVGLQRPRDGGRGTVGEDRVGADVYQ